MEMLFHARWNLPKAAEHCNLTTKEMKITFNEYCQFHPQDVPTELAKTFKEGSEEAS
tara:strand:+ start:723 stop:893 length:171 start_codon:yes stop_codon:yes gene_type:complete